MNAGRSLLTIIVGGLAVNYVDEGQGEPILMLHGWGSDYHVYDLLAERLKLHYRIVRINLPGFGGSQMPPLRWGTRDYAKLVYAFCKKIELEPHALAGHSFGGQTAVHLVGTGRLQPERLILLAASAIRPPADIRLRTYRLIAKAGKAVIGGTSLAGRARQRLYRSAGTNDYLESGKLQTIYRRVVGEDQQEYARRIACRTLLVWGDQDNDAPLDRGRLLSRLIPDSQLEVLPGAGHFVMIDRPSEVASLMEKFLSE